ATLASAPPHPGGVEADGRRTIYRKIFTPPKFKILEFLQTAGYKLTDVGDEVIAAHPLTGRGLAAYGTFLVEHSPWLKEMQLVEQSHDQFDAEKWSKIKHFMLCFKDRIFEVLAIEANSAGEADSVDTATSIALRRLRSR
ncbi:MAG TPA: hypothetical protein VFZ59_03290, partial [Verrucomicrobiae bacterium]|nr:hypothetical protein [Verrucomicrobiae bacterium]